MKKVKVVRRKITEQVGNPEALELWKIAAGDDMNDKSKGMQHPIGIDIQGFPARDTGILMTLDEFVKLSTHNKMYVCIQLSTDVKIFMEIPLKSVHENK